MPASTPPTLSITPRVLAHLGDELIRNEIIALTELVKNSYDAGATECIVSFTFENKKSYIPSKIVISDNGVGMNENDIINKWLVIGTDNKKVKLNNSKINDLSKYGLPNRIPLGEKGIGRFGSHKLGNIIILKTKKIDSKETLTVNMDWSLLSSISKLDEFEIKLTKDTSFKSKHGTVIEIENIKNREEDAWSRGKLRNIHRALTALNAKFSPSDCRIKNNKTVNKMLNLNRDMTTSDEFTVTIATDTRPEIFQKLKTFDEIKQSALYECDILLDEGEIIEFEYKFNPWKKIEDQFPERTVNISELKDSEKLIQRKLSKEEKYEKEYEDINSDTRTRLHGKDFIPCPILKGVGPVYVKIYAFEQSTAITQHLDLRGQIKDYLAENSGIRVFRNGVRVYDYGEKGNDWIGLSEIGNIGDKLRNEHVVGFVFLDRKASINLIEKTNREGFVENPAYESLVTALQWAIKYVFVEYRNRDKRHLSEFYSKTIEPVITILTDAYNFINENITDSNHKKILSTYILKIETQYKSIIGTLYQSAGVGVLSASILHEVEKIIKSAMHCIKESNIEKLEILIRRIDETIKKFSFLIKKSEIKPTSTENIIAKPLSFTRLRLKNHGININKIEQNNLPNCLASATHATNVLINIIDNSIYWLNASKDKRKKITVITTSRLLPKHVSIIVLDNGPGFADDPTYLIKPFVTTKPFALGSGLGLYIAHELMNEMGGSLSFPTHDELLQVIDEEIPPKGAIVALNFRTSK